MPLVDSEPLIPLGMRSEVAMSDNSVPEADSEVFEKSEKKERISPAGRENGMRGEESFFWYECEA